MGRLWHGSIEQIMSETAPPPVESTELESSPQELSFTTDSIPEGITPHQWKIALRKERRAMRKQEAMLQRKERDKKKKEERRLLKKRKAEEHQPLSREVSFTPRAKRKKMSDSSASNLRVAVDLSYNDLMNEKDLKKVMHQCQRCYSANRRAEAPLQLYLTSFSSSTEDVWDRQHTQYRSWDVYRREEGFMELFGKENVVFLTSESPNILQDLDASKVYVIGGLVDHNHQKGYCYQKAVELDISHAQLPISQYIKLNCRAVLAINHVFEILLEFSACKDWEKAFHTVIPPRKVISTPPGSTSSSTTTTTTTEPGGETDIDTTPTSAEICGSPSTKQEQPVPLETDSNDIKIEVMGPHDPSPVKTEVAATVSTDSSETVSVEENSSQKQCHKPSIT